MTDRVEIGPNTVGAIVLPVIYLGQEVDLYLLNLTLTPVDGGPGVGPHGLFPGGLRTRMDVTLTGHWVDLHPSR